MEEEKKKEEGKRKEETKQNIENPVCTSGAKSQRQW